MANKLLGKTATDLITGFKGVITGHASYITGCDQVSLTGKANDTSTGASMWVDVNRIELDYVTKQIVLDTTSDAGACDAPTKS